MSTYIMQASQPFPAANFTSNQGKIPLDLLPIRGPNGGLLHVLKFVIRLDDVSSAAGPDATHWDGAALAHLIEFVSLQAAPNGPMGGRRAQIINEQPGYFAQQALCAMTGAPVQAAAQAMYRDPTEDGFDNNGANTFGSATGYRRNRILSGWAHQQGPFVMTKAATGLASVPLNYVFAVGERAGEVENGGMNPIPVGAFTGTGGVGGACAGKGGGVGQFQLKLRKSILNGSVAITYAGNVTVYAQVIELPYLHIPVAPSIQNFTSNNAVVKFPKGIAGLHAFMEDISPVTGDMQLTDFTGVNYLTAKYKGADLWPIQDYGPSLYGSLSQLDGFDSERFSFQEQAAADIRLTGLYGTKQYASPGQIIVLHRGPASRAPAFGDETCDDQLTVTLVGSPTAVTRNLVSGIWVRNDDEYIAGWKEYSGATELVPNTKFGAMSPSAQTRGMLANVPLKAETAMCK